MSAISPSEALVAASVLKAETSVVVEQVPATTVSTGDATITATGSTSTETQKDTNSQAVDDSATGTPAPSVSVVLSPPKTTEELIAARALKRIARRTAIREKAEGYKRAGDILFDSRNYKASYAQYLLAIDLCPSKPSYFISLAAAYRKLKWYEEAAHAATRALTLDPKNTEARYVRGVSRLEQRLLRPAKIDFETVLEHDPSHLLARAALTEVTHFIETSTQLGTHALGPNPVDELVKDVDFSFPHYDQDALEIAELSDSSDCHHVGNGVQCRFYNHDGCSRGSACTFSHAPDEKSVRDDLGKNVCIYFLLDSCKFGPAKCIYSHSKVALPKHGWWTSPEQIAKVKSVLEVAEQKSREQRQLENERWKAYVKAMKAGMAKPPKSAGIKKEKKEGGPEAAASPTEPTTPKSAVPAGQKKKESGKPNGTQRRKGPASGNRRKKPASATDNASAPTTTDAGQPPATTDNTTSSFTDYKLNVPPSDVKPEPTETLSY
ncbi:hypothetical protein JR316_0012080 [Psilocybe cubensis]|uniref:Uncharacterized protein n=2 Tax=Psilocybe cubensis TaxID=181762 RepID=A0ACB8GH50_PSICU|nr:hypothetical protein JR316_0012080 [Psilocybe cubensis]KAH9474981.1 hypothetical protein JR316_0012080 [Psilocybe cubensis]